MKIVQWDLTGLGIFRKSFYYLSTLRKSVKSKIIPFVMEFQSLDIEKGRNCPTKMDSSASESPLNIITRH